MKISTKISKRLIPFCAAVLFATGVCAFPCAASIVVSPSETISEQEYKDYRTEEFDLPYGGLNEFKGEKYDNRTLALQKERELRAKGYVLINTNEKEISDEQYQILKDSGFWFHYYLEPTNKLSWQFSKVYMYKPLLEKYCANYSKGFTETIETRIEIEESTAVIAYEVWYMNDKVGKISDEFNENIPEWFDTAYLEINSNINCEITLVSEEMQCFYRFYISKGTPFMVKLPRGQYNVREINAVTLSRIEKAMTHNNLIYLSEENADRDHAYVIDITKIVSKYKIPEGDISGMPDYSIDKNQIIPEERTVVDPEAIAKAQERVQKEAEKQEQERLEEESKTPAEKVQEEKRKSNLILAGIGTFIVLFIWIIAKSIIERMRKKNNEQDDEEIRK